MARVLIVDNYDSFTYNLAHAFMKAACDVDVRRNDAITRDEVQAGQYDALVLSPGPGTPANDRDFGVCRHLITDPLPQIPMLGVCLGMQGMAHWSGGTIQAAPEVIHGEASPVTLSNSPLWNGLGDQVRVGRYHSLVVDGDSLPAVWRPTAHAADGTLMAMDHDSLPWHGVQFHPESILTPVGQAMITNFLEAH